MKMIEMQSAAGMAFGTIREHKMRSILTVLGVKRVVAQHIQSLLGQIRLHNMIDVFIVPPGHMHIFQTAIRFVNTIFSVIPRVVMIFIIFKIF